MRDVRFIIFVELALFYPGSLLLVFFTTFSCFFHNVPRLTEKSCLCGRRPRAFPAKLAYKAAAISPGIKISEGNAQLSRNKARFSDGTQVSVEDATRRKKMHTRVVRSSPPLSPDEICIGPFLIAELPRACDSSSSRNLPRDQHEKRRPSGGICISRLIKKF